MRTIPEDYLIVIPARFGSTRFPGKALADIGGKPMIIRTAERCLQVARKNQVVVATDDKRIIEACEAHGIWAELTKKEHQTGTDRVAEISRRFQAKRYLNVQGDEPVLNPRDIVSVADVSEDPLVTITGYCQLEKHMWGDSKHIKLVFGNSSQLLYISRADIPGSHSGEFVEGFRQVCIYSYSRESLDQVQSTAGRSRLESIEDHELLRFLELGLQVQVVELSSDSISVDRPKDIELVLKRIKSE